MDGKKMLGATVCLGLSFIFCDVMLCQAQVTTDAVCQTPTDLIICIDGSDSLFSQDFMRQKAFAVGIINGVGLDKDEGFVVGVIAFSTAMQVIHLNPPQSGVRLVQAIGQLTHEREGTHTDKAIDLARRIMATEGREFAQKVVVIITDGRSKNPDRTAAAAQLAMDAGIEMMAVGVGEFVVQSELQSISKHNNVYYVANFEALLELTLNISKAVCETSTIPPTTTTATTTTTITSTAPTTSTSMTTTPISRATDPPKDLCDDCRFLNGVGYNRDPVSCSNFYQCVFIGGRLVAYIRPCPHGQFWDQGMLTCRLANEVYCINDPCRAGSIQNHAHSENCAAYWQCSDGHTWRIRCCSSGASYIEGIGCTPSTICGDTCPPANTGSTPPATTACDKWSDASSPGKFWQTIHGRRIQRDCAPGTTFSDLTCECSLFARFVPPAPDACLPEIYLPFDVNFEDHSSHKVAVYKEGGVSIDQNPPQPPTGRGAAKFDGTGRLIIWRFANDDFGDEFVIRFKYLELRDGGTGKLESLVSNADCNISSSVSVSLDRAIGITRANVVTRQNGQKLQTSQLNTGTWKDVEYRYGNGKFSITVNGMIDSELTVGDIKRSHAALQIASGCPDTSRFSGYIDEFMVYKCLP